MRDEIDDELDSLLQGHMDIEASGATNKGGSAITEAEIASVGEPERVMQMPEMDIRPEANEPRPGSVKAQVGAAVTGAKAPARPAPVRDTELEGLQADAKKRRDFSQLGQAVTDFTERPTNLLDYAQRLGGGGVSQAPKSKMWQENAAEGDRALEDLAARRKSEAGMEAQQATRAASADDNDPNGQTAQVYRHVLLSFKPDMAEQLANATPKQMRAMAPFLEKIAAENNDLIQARMKADADAKAKAAAKEQHDAERAEDVAARKQSHEDSLGMQRATLGMTAAGLGLRQGADARDAAKDARDAAEKAKGHTLAPTAVTDLSDAQTAIAGLSSLGAEFKRLNMSGVLAKYSGKATDMFDLQGTDAAEYKAAALRGMQGVGKIMEGGKLATSDEDKYRRMLPRAGDPDEVADQKIAASQAFLSELVQNRIRALKAAGYNVPAIDTAKTGGAVEITDKKGQKYSVPAAESEALKAELRAEGLL